MNFYRKIISAVLLASMVCLPQALLAKGKHHGRYLAGDFHNHTTSTDGSTSAQRLTYEAVDSYGLDWFAQSGHGGQYSRDGRLDDFAYDCQADLQGDVWENTVGLDNIKGDPTSPNAYPSGCGAHGMWRWQSLQEYIYPKMIEKYNQYKKPIWLGYEFTVPGHEHCSMGTLVGQFDKKDGNADLLAQFEYLFDANDHDMSEGGGQGWTGKIPNLTGDDTDYGNIMHEKTVKGVKWLQRKDPKTGYVIWAHIERKGPFDPDDAYGDGYNVEHFRNFNNAGPDVAFGWEGQPGHQASGSRGGFGDHAFGGTRGGTGTHSAEVGGMWDALLGEGRNWFNFASSDWHNRGSFPPYAQETTNDFWPGEFQKTYTYVKKNNPKPKDIVKSLKSGNSFTVMGDLIDDLEFTIGKNDNKEATMGETLKSKKGDHLLITVRFHDPEGKNHSPYAFDNPSLLQVGINQPLNMPEVDNVQLICGDVTGKIPPRKTEEYTYPKNDNMWDVVVVSRDEMVDEGDGWYSYEYYVTAESDFYCRLRGTNLPPGTPYETYPLDTDASEGPGGPMPDNDFAGTGLYGAEYIPCNDEACPEHIDGYLTNDVEAWADIWFYANPIFVDVK
jgi:hypothetical protein